MEPRRRLRKTFEQAGPAYHAFRPRYPDALFERVHALAGLANGATCEALEIGPATGIATEPMAVRGHRITGVELGPTLAAEARTNLARFPDVEIVVASFDDWEPASWGTFDLVYAATAWYWLDPATRATRAHRHLRPRGVLAIWSANHVVPAGGDPFFAEIQPVYDRIGESAPADWTFPRPGELPDHGDELVASGCFEVLAVEHFDWEATYDADAYIGLLDTFSGHIAMEPQKREILDGEIRLRLAERPDGLLRRHWGCALTVARARST